MHRRALISAALTAPFLHGCSEAADRLSAPAVTEGLDAGLLDQADVAAAELPKLQSMIISRDGRRLFERSSTARRLRHR
nr:hypothetical protein [uncultured Brevundimonas sp.]